MTFDRSNWMRQCDKVQILQCGGGVICRLWLGDLAVMSMRNESCHLIVAHFRVCAFCVMLFCKLQSFTNCSRLFSPTTLHGDVSATNFLAPCGRSRTPGQGSPLLKIHVTAGFADCNNRLAVLLVRPAIAALMQIILHQANVARREEKWK